MSSAKNPEKRPRRRGARGRFVTDTGAASGGDGPDAISQAASALWYLSHGQNAGSQLEANPPGLMALTEAIIPLGNWGLVHCVTALETGLILMGMVVLVHMAIVMILIWMMSLSLMTLTLTTNLRRILLT